MRMHGLPHSSYAAACLCAGNGDINHPPIPTAELFSEPAKCTSDQVTKLNNGWREPVVALIESWSATTNKAGNGLVGEHALHCILA